MSDDEPKAEPTPSVPARARTDAGEPGADSPRTFDPPRDGTIAMPLHAFGAPTDVDAPMSSRMLDSYQPRPTGTVGMSSPPSRLEARWSEIPASEGPRSSRRGGRELIVPSSATVESILEHVRRPPAERLDVEAKVASGGMGTIDVAVDRALDRRIAIKTLHRHLRHNESSVRMFLREARLTGLLDHPHIVPVYELGERGDGQLFFAMKLVEGRTLADIVRSLPRGVLDTATLYMLLDVIAKVCDALAFAHSRGVLHCDVKPANVMVGEFGQVFLMDWGIARLVAGDAADASEGSIAEGNSAQAPHGGPPERHAPRAARAPSTDDSIIGTPCYMSPEQARGDRRRLDARSDVFLLGATLYELLTRRPPYLSDDRGETLALAAAGTFPSPRKVAGDAAVPLELERIVMRAMATEPTDRYPTVTAFREDLVRFMRGGAEFPRCSYAPGEAIVREGEPGSAAYILVEGRCEIRKETPSGHQTLQTIGPGTVFGEMAILTEGPRTATVIALEPTTVLVVTSQVLEQEMAALKPWMATLLKSLASRFRVADTQARATHAASPSPARLANQILMLAVTWGEADDDGGRWVRWSTLASELEAQLGAPPVALFGAITRYGLALDVERDRLTVPDVEALRARLRAER